MDIFKVPRRKSFEKLNCDTVTRKEEKEELQFQEMLDCAEKSSVELEITKERAREARAKADESVSNAELAKEKIKSEKSHRHNETAQTVIKGMGTALAPVGLITAIGLVQAFNRDSELSLTKSDEELRKGFIFKIVDLFIKK